MNVNTLNVLTLIVTDNVLLETCFDKDATYIQDLVHFEWPTLNLSNVDWQLIVDVTYSYSL